MHDDPFDTRDRGLRRVRAVTASVAAAAFVGTGVIVYELAAPSTADAQQTVQPGDGSQQVVPQQGEDGEQSENGQLSGDDGGGSIQPPAQLPAPAPFGGRNHASSGGS